MKTICFLNAYVTGMNLLTGVSLINADLTNADLNNSNLFHGTLIAADLISATLSSGNLITEAAFNCKVYCSGLLYHESSHGIAFVQCQNVELIPPKNSSFTVFGSVVTNSNATGGKLNYGHIIQCGITSPGNWSGGNPPSNSPWQGHYVGAKLKNAKINQAGLISVDLNNPNLKSSTVNVMGATYAGWNQKNGIYVGGQIS